jgi:hypothetical protein
MASIVLLNPLINKKNALRKNMNNIEINLQAGNILKLTSVNTLDILNYKDFR